MKKSVYLICTLCLLSGIWQACGSKEEVTTTGGIYGTVLDKEDGEPIRNAEISLSPGGKTTVVGSNGTYEFIDLEPRLYTVNVTADGYDYNCKTAKVVSGESTACDFHLTKTVVNQELEITPTALHFGTTQDQLSVTITNKGTEETSWSLNLGSNAWLSASPTSGNIAAGKTQTIVCSVNRTSMTKDESAVVGLSAFGNSYPLTISCEINKGKLNVTPTVLDFGEDQSELSFTIKNIGNAAMPWSVTGLSASCLSLSELSGSIAVGASKVVKLTLDRSLLDSDLSTSFIVKDSFTEQEIQVSAKKKVLQSVLSVSPTLLNFGEDDSVLSFTIKNSGNTAMSWSAKGLSATCLSLSDMGGTVAVGASKVVKLTLDRTALTSDLSTSFTIADGYTEQEIQVSATKKVLRPIMNVSPTVLDFGDSSTSKTFTISNSGTANLDWSLMDATNPCLTFSDYSGSVAPGGKQTVTITLDRAAMAANLNVVIKVSDGTNTQSITIKATYVYVEDYSSAIIESFDNRLKCDIVSCKRNGSKVEFKFKLTSIGMGDVEVTIFGNQGNSNSTIIADNLGTQYAGSVLTLGTQSNYYYTDGYVKSPLLEYVPINGSATIPGVPSGATSLHIKLNVSVWSNGNYIANSDWIKISNLPIY